MKGLPLLMALAFLSAAPAGAEILFARESGVPPVVQDFAWRVIEGHCRYQSHERAQRSFWAYRTRVERIAGETVYSIQIVSEVGWAKTDPPAFVEMTVSTAPATPAPATVADDGRPRLTTLSSSFIPCAR